MAEKITPKEHTWLTLKYGTDYLYRLGRMGQPRKHGGSGMEFSGVEAKAARLGLDVVKKREEALIKEIEEKISTEIRSEIDKEILKTLWQAGEDEAN